MFPFRSFASGGREVIKAILKPISSNGSSETYTVTTMDRIIERSQEGIELARNVGRAAVLFVTAPDVLAEIMADHEPTRPDDNPDFQPPIEDLS